MFVPRQWDLNQVLAQFFAVISPQRNVQPKCGMEYYQKPKEHALFQILAPYNKVFSHERGLFLESEEP